LAHEEFKKAFKHKMGFVLGPLSVHDPLHKPPDLDEALSLLGRLHVRLVVIQEIVDLIQHLLCKSCLSWPRELFDLREATNKQIKLVEEIVKAILYHQEKSNSSR
jgi:hypothetical protein